ncbi:MAG: hypothetical protein GY822_10730 [Deltaproteobacteria bacterium]|nr:hypothetical protein [Deltaproteobacteria bacterium]
MTSESSKFPSPWSVKGDSQEPRSLLSDEERHAKCDADDEVVAAGDCFSSALPRALTVAAALEGEDPWRGSSKEDCAPAYESNRHRKDKEEAKNDQKHQETLPFASQQEHVVDGEITKEDAGEPLVLDDGGFGAASNATMRLGTGDLGGTQNRDLNICPSQGFVDVEDEMPTGHIKRTEDSPWNAASNTTLIYERQKGLGQEGENPLELPSPLAIEVHDDGVPDPWNTPGNTTQLYSSQEGPVTRSTPESGDPWSAPTNSTQIYGQPNGEKKQETSNVDVEAETKPRPQQKPEQASAQIALKSLTSRFATEGEASNDVQLDSGDSDGDKLQKEDNWAGDTQRFGTGCLGPRR